MNGRRCRALLAPHPAVLVEHFIDPMPVDSKNIVLLLTQYLMPAISFPEMLKPICCHPSFSIWIIRLYGKLLLNITGSKPSSFQISSTVTTLV